jgi:hypothetical protein
VKIAERKLAEKPVNARKSKQQAAIDAVKEKEERKLAPIEVFVTFNEESARNPRAHLFRECDGVLIVYEYNSSGVDLSEKVAIGPFWRVLDHINNVEQSSHRLMRLLVLGIDT